MTTREPTESYKKLLVINREWSAARVPLASPVPGLQSGPGEPVQDAGSGMRRGMSPGVAGPSLSCSMGSAWRAGRVRGPSAG